MLLVNVVITIKAELFVAQSYNLLCSLDQKYLISLVKGLNFSIFLKSHRQLKMLLMSSITTHMKEV